MNKTQAIAAMRKMWGDKTAYRRNEDAPVGEERDALIATLPALRAASEAAKAARDARREELLKDLEYVRLREEATKAREVADRAAGRAYTRRVTIGTVANLGGLSMFTVRGEGDNWQEAIDKARATASGSLKV